MCAKCVIDLLEIFRERNVSVNELLTHEFVQTSIENETMPNGSYIQQMNDGQSSILLPQSFVDELCNVSTECTQMTIVNQSLFLDYEIEGQS